MKKIFALIVSIHLLYATSSTQTLVASYPFTGNANDVSGNNNNGTVFGATLTTDRFGNANSAYSFDGSSSYIDVPNSPTLQLSNAYTLSAWVKPNGFYSGPCQANFILAKGAQASEGHYNLQYGDFLDGNCGMFTPTNENFASTLRKGGTEQSVFENPSTLPVTLNNWYYVVCTYDGMSQKLFVNGKLRASNATSGSFGVLNTQNLFIGKSNDASGYFVNGSIDDIKIYSSALTDAQIFDSYVNDLKKPGSGNSLQFVRTLDVNTCPSLNIGSGYSFGSQPFTFETWVKKDEVLNVPTNIGRIIIVSEANNGWAAGLLNDGQLFLSDVGNSGQGSGVVCITPNDLNWHHIAITFAANTVSFYVDGILKATQPYVVSFNGGGDYSLAFRQSFKPHTEQNLSGRMDEVRIWKNVALSQAEIRDWMCKKITSTHPQYQNLFGYFRADEGTASLTGGYNGKFGNMVNSASINWLTSAAPLGDAANHDFVNATKTANISAATGENFSVTSTSGSPDGIVVYHVGEAPNSNTGANNGGNNKYFGVFQSGGTIPQYTAVYDYTLNPMVNAGNENTLRLAKRADNAVATWTQMSTLPNEPANTITVTGESTEYILGALGTPLPVTLLNFAASKCNSGICLLWTTENEQDFSHYEVEKSNDGIQFTKMSSVVAQNFPQRNTYTTSDNNPVNGANYYRLKQVNTDNRYTYSRVLKVDLAKPQLISVQPNPATHSIAVKGLNGYQHIRLVDVNGKIQFQKTVQLAIEEINIAQLVSGIYILQAIKENEITTIKLLKQ